MRRASDGGRPRTGGVLPVPELASPAMKTAMLSGDRYRYRIRSATQDSGAIQSILGGDGRSCRGDAVGFRATTSLRVNF